MPSRAELVAEARTYLETPFHHQGRVKGTGIDCAGVLANLVNFMGYDVRERTNYGQSGNADLFLDGLRKVMVHVDEDEQILPGDFLLFPRGPGDYHGSVATDPGRMLHAWADRGKVVEHSMGRRWMRKLHSVWRFPELR